MDKIIELPTLTPLHAVLTGAADEIGSACARALRNAGFELVVADIDKVPLARLAHEIGAHAIPCDVLAEFSVQELVRETRALFPSVDLLINAAGSSYVRTLGMMRVSRAFTEAAEGRWLTVVNLAAATRGKPEPFGYAGSKQAFRRLSDGLGAALLPQGVHVMAVEDIDAPEDAAARVLQLCRGVGTLSDSKVRRIGRREPACDEAEACRLLPNALFQSHV